MTTIPETARACAETLDPDTFFTLPDWERRRAILQAASLLKTMAAVISADHPDTPALVDALTGMRGLIDGIWQSEPVEKRMLNPAYRAMAEALAAATAIRARTTP